MLQRQRGSVIVFIVAIISVIVLVIVLGGASLQSQKELNNLPQLKDTYLDRAKDQLELWYRKNALRLDNPVGGSCAYNPSETEIFRDAGLSREYGVRIQLSPCMQDQELVYRDISIWLPAIGFADTAQFVQQGSIHIFQPGNTSTKYRIISGRTIETKMMAETRTMLSELARLLEARFKAKIERDPSHDLRVNHFKAQDCEAPLIVDGMYEEIPCTIASPSDPTSDAYLILDDTGFDSLKLEQILSISKNGVRDSWGQYIVFNNYLKGGANPDPCVSLGDGTEEPNPNKPPYSMLLQTVTPWGEPITICPIQPVN